MNSTVTTASQNADNTWASPRHKRTVYLILAVVGISILFDGYDLVIYGAVLSSLLNDPNQLGELSPAMAGTLGSYAMVGVMIGALSAGAIGDRVGRRKVMLTAVVWFSIGMALTAMANTIVMFGLLRFLTGLGVGMIVATGGAIIAEFAPANRRNLFNAIVYSGVPAGGVMASLFAIWFEDLIGWRGLFLIGASPLLFLLPLAWFALPESPRWLVARGRKADARAICIKHGLPEDQFIVEDTVAEAVVEDAADAAKAQKDVEKTGFAGIFSRAYLPGTLLIGAMSFIGLLSTYGLNTWLPEIMRAAGTSAENSLYSLLALNGGAVIGGLVASWFADRIGAKTIVTTTFTLAAFCLFGLPLISFAPLLYIAIAFAGVGVLGTQVLTYGLASNYYGTASRAAGVAWVAGFGRLGGIFGPALGGLIISAGLGASNAFYLFAGVAVIGAICTALIPRSPAAAEVVISQAPTSAKAGGNSPNEPALNASNN